MTAPDNDYVTWGAFEWIGGIFVMALAALAGAVLKVLGKSSVADERITQLILRNDERHRENREALEKISETLERLSDKMDGRYQYRPGHY